MSDSLMQLLDPEAIVLGSDASTNEQIIRILAGRLETLGYVKNSYADAVVRRELTIPTGLPLERPDNVAVPHTDPEHVLKPGIALGTLKHPVVFANMEDPDEKLPVGFVFLLAINDKDKQIEALQAVMATIQNSDALDGLRSATTLDDVRAVLG
ncbi:MULTISPECIES: PTS sugar transporter subunit IIA [unclassified Mesorhizobium]|uniref:PTS sugar transporter subunit IIA n=1 Tax=unclassified Mesorhizobium TaxID=325217 RepID=UPI00112E85CE|nr:MULTISPECIES: PTS sugar transporter subunit IIA [unclassified Mesorhizobium]MBZ9985233.1 PTS sugar transporter subunit IIA [Mesorhizobium sp. BR-1-1-8]TPK53792.1 PTS sugar transporter subunit IIA [Mesorhizobium sp. B2-5-2]TPL17199.1 PTS sugar transporter subunit IIA [Mesorhizobium sp. B2-4-7]TPL28742.1 PTS sugar transporter subunit IIA [Mesorhizobium sp. B2-4-8]TPL28928.1 PTS sugar transporter subunit IIA [Mesorhizobium sp. B2-4-9]